MPNPGVVTMQSTGQTTFALAAKPVGGASGPAGGSNADITMLSAMPAGMSASFNTPQILSSGETVWRLKLQGSPRVAASVTSMNVAAQVTDSLSGVTYAVTGITPVNIVQSQSALALSVSSKQLDVLQGSTVSEAINLLASGCVGGPAALSVSGAPDGISVDWSANPVALSPMNGSATFTVTASPSAQPDVFSLLITATEADVTATQQVTLQVHPSQLTFSFNIDEDGTHTSAGFYDSKGTLVRTLWSNISYPSGSHIRAWDGNTDGGTLSTGPGPYTIKILTNQVNYKMGRSRWNY